MNEMRRIELPDEMDAVLEDLVAGNEVVFTRHGRDVGGMVPRDAEARSELGVAPEQGRPDGLLKLAEWGRQVGVNVHPSITVEEILDWRDRGRR